MPNSRCHQPAWHVAHDRGLRRAVMRVLLFVLSICLFSGQALARQLDAQIDRTRVAEGETVTLRLSASGDTRGDPDLSPLTGDFDILSQGQSTQMNIVNGRSSSTHEWRLVLLPKRSGKLTIPPLRLDGMQSRPLRLEVLPAGAPQAGATKRGRPVMLEIEVDPRRPYVQGEVSYRVKILSRAPLREASLSEPQAGDAIVERLGKDSHYTTQRNGETYQVTERRYAIFPQHSGTLRIESPVLSAAVPAERSRRVPGGRFPGAGAFSEIEKFFGRNPFAGFPDMDDLFEETRPVRVRGRSMTLDVRPRPAASQDPWLPAKGLRLSETWSPDPPVFRVGEPVTRTVELVAEGLTAAQLPALTTPVPEGLKVYPDQPQSETDSRGDDLVATRTLKAALVPVSPGKLTLPEMEVHWWDTESERARVATLPARSIEVLPAGPGTREVTANSKVDEPSAGASAQAADALPKASPPSAGPAPAEDEAIRWQASYWPWLAGAATLGWLVTMVLWLRAREHRGPTSGEPRPAARAEPSRKQRLAQSRMRLKKACLSNDPRAARAALLDWASARWPDTRARGLSELAGRVAAEEARTELTTLDRVLYDPAMSDRWDGRRAWSTLDHTLQELQSENDSGKSESLPDLYPQRG
jgi:hypothetical protein